MTDTSSDASHTGSDGLWRWLVGGLLAGAAILGLLVAAYAIGYHRGKDSGASPSAAPAVPATTAATTTASTTPGTAGPVTPTPALVSRGKQLFAADSCAGCHSLSGTNGSGPALNGVAGSQVALDTGQAVTADDAFLERSITAPDAQIAKGFRPGIMSSAIAGFGLDGKPEDVRALVAYIKSQK